jgi:hypothetical protein
MREEVEPEPVRSTPALRRFIIYGAVLLVVFLLGFIPMWLKARQCASSLAEADRQLALVRMRHDIASAAIDAQRGDYEPARQAASQFFTSVRTEIDEGDVSDLTQTQRQDVTPLLAARDEIITLLARSDPASADRLSELYVKYRAAMGQQPR